MNYTNLESRWYRQADPKHQRQPFLTFSNPPNMYEQGNETARIRVTEGRVEIANNGIAGKQRESITSPHHIEGDHRTRKREEEIRERRKDATQHQKGNRAVEKEEYVSQPIWLDNQLTRGQML